jgi:hypothetical protein
LFIGLALVLIGVALVTGPDYVGFAAWDDSGIRSFPMP